MAMFFSHRFLEQLKTSKIVKLEGYSSTSGSSYQHTMCLFDDGSLYGQGNNSSGQTGVSRAVSSSHVQDFTLVLTNVKDVGIGGDGTIALKNDGTVWVAGLQTVVGMYNTGIDTELGFVQCPQFDNEVVKIIGGNGNVAAIDADGNYWAGGYPTEYKKFGSSASGDYIPFTNLKPNIKDCCFAQQASYIITKDGEVYGCGRDNAGNFGDISGNLTDYTKLNVPVAVTEGVCWNYGCMFLSEDKTIYGSGSGYSGVFGYSSSPTSSTGQFVQMQIDNVKQFKVNKYSSSNTTCWVLKNDNTLWGCGENSDGQQGANNTTDVKLPVQRASNVLSFDCSPITTWYVNDSGELWGCGDGSSRQQGNGTTSDVRVFTKRLDNMTGCFATEKVSWAYNDNSAYRCYSSSNFQPVTILR